MDSVATQPCNRCVHLVSKCGGLVVFVFSLKVTLVQGKFCVKLAAGILKELKQKVGIKGECLPDDHDLLL